jgi:hypothetical protein
VQPLSKKQEQIKNIENTKDKKIKKI